MKKALITGANKGIGFETAKQMVQLGYFVYLGSRDQTKGLDAIDRLKSAGISNAAWVEIDVADMGSVIRAQQAVADETEVLDVLINNAAIAGSQPQNISGCTMEDLRKIFDTNFFGLVYTTQRFIPLLKKSKNPVIINVSSEIGSLAMNTKPERNANWDLYNAYGASKTALNAFTVMLSNEFRDTNFTVNSVTPGYTATDLNQFKGLKTVEQGAGTIVKYATMDHQGQTGKFYGERGDLPW